MIRKERQRRFCLLLEDYKNQEEASVALGFSSLSPVSNYKRGHKAMGEKVARQIELYADLPKGVFVDPLKTPWRIHDSSQFSDRTNEGHSDSILETSNIVTDAEKYARIQSFEHWRGSVENEIRHMNIPLESLSALGLHANQLKSIEMPDESQFSRIRKGDHVVVNIEFTAPPKNNTVYAIKLGGQYTLRRVSYKASGGLTLSCSNVDYPDDSVSADEIASLDILGEFVLFQGTTF